MEKMTSLRFKYCSPTNKSEINEIQRIVSALNKAPERYLKRCGIGAYQQELWTFSDVDDAKAHLTKMLSKYLVVNNLEVEYSAVGADTPHWMCNGSIIDFMGGCGLLSIDGDKAYATPWLSTVAAHM